MAYRLTRKRLGDDTGLAALILYWLAFEYMHHQWDLSWPWLTLGNAFADHPGWVWFYRYTGTTGGSLWVLLMNVLLYKVYCSLGNRKATWAYLLPVILLLQSTIRDRFNKKEMDPGISMNNLPNVVVVQPNVEPYTEKFTTAPERLVAELIRLSESKLDSQTRLVVWPETAIPAQAWENRLLETPAFQPIYAFLQRHPQIMLVSGIDSYRYYGPENPGRFSIRQMDDGSHYEAFNTALAIDARLQPQLYHKSKLVPGVETLPEWMGFMGGLFDDFGGISGTLGRSDTPVVFSAPGNPYRPAPIICYESIYSDYITEYIRRGANILTVVTNDGWWGNTPGHRQHMAMSRLRAVEHQIWVARSANTGISAIIDPRGEVHEPLGWDVEGAIKLEVPPQPETTFYGRHGDWISRAAWPLALALLAFTGWRSWRKRKVQVGP
jgi:apolipoprotein N-acyltransferase